MSDLSTFYPVGVIGDTGGTGQSKPLLHVQDQKPQGTSGGNMVSSTWTARDLNTVLTNDISGASLSSNVITLPAGEYYVEGAQLLNANSTHRLVHSAIYVDGLEVLRGPAGDVYRGVDITHTIAGRISLTSSSDVELYYYSNGAETNGLGVASDEGVGVFSDLRIWQLDAEKEYPRVYQPVNQPVTGAYVTGNIFGGELVYNDTTTVDVNPFSCMSDDLTTELAINATTNVDLGTPSINTTYHIFAVKYAGGTFGCEDDTDVNGATLPATVAYKRWLGFLRTDSSGNIEDFRMFGDEIEFKKPGGIDVTGNPITSASVFVPDYAGAGFPTSKIVSVALWGESITAEDILVDAYPDGSTKEYNIVNIIAGTTLQKNACVPIHIPLDLGIKAYDSSRNGGYLGVKRAKLRR